MFQVISFVFGFLLLLAVLVVIDRRKRYVITTWLNKSPNRLWLLPAIVVSYYCLVAYLNGAWEIKEVIKLIIYFAVLVLILRFFEKPADNRIFPFVVFILAIWMPTEFGLLPMLWGNVGGLPFPGAVWFGIITFLLAADFWKNPKINCSWWLDVDDLKTISKVFVLLLILIAPAAISINFIKLSLSRDVSNYPAFAIIVFLGIFLTTALVEEIIFRGFIQGLVMTRMKFLPGLIVSLIIFGLSHLNNNVKDYNFPNWWYVLFATIAGIGYGYVYHKRKSIVASAALHALVDFTWVIFFQG